MSRVDNTEKKESEALKELKERLWANIQVLDAELHSLENRKDEKAKEEYRKNMDAYHKMVKAYMDIIKVQRYAPGNLQDKETDDIATLMRKVKARETLEASDKIALQEFKDFLNYVKKGSLTSKKHRR